MSKKILLLIMIVLLVVGCSKKEEKEKFQTIENITLITPDIGISEVNIINDIEHIKVIKGNKVNLAIYVEPTNLTTDKIIWVNSNSKVATIDSDGTITAINTGTSTIYARSDKNKDVKSNIIQIEVINSNE